MHVSESRATLEFGTDDKSSFVRIQEFFAEANNLVSGRPLGSIQRAETAERLVLSACPNLYAVPFHCLPRRTLSRMTSVVAAQRNGFG